MGQPTIIYLILKPGKNIFGLHLKESLIRKSLQIFRPFLTTMFMLRIFSIRLTFLMIISSINAKLVIMVVSCLILSLEQIYPDISNTDQIIEIIQKYSSKKSHGCDEISVAMLQLCAREGALPLSLIFQRCLLTGTFPVPWKCANVQRLFIKKPVKENVITGLFHFYLFVAKYKKK